MPIDASKVVWDKAPTIDPNLVKWDAASSNSQKQPVMRQDAPVGGASFDPNTGEVVIDDGQRGGAANSLDAFVRGIGSGLGSLVRSSNMKQQAQPYKEQMPIATGAGEFVGEVAPTLPVGGVLAKGLLKVAPQATNLANAIRSGGMAEGALGTRIGGGAITAGTQSAFIDADPTSIGVGAALGGTLGGVVGKGLSKAMPAGVSAAREAGYVIPPTQAGGGVLSRMGEGLSGKAATAQAASVKNQEITNALAAKAVGLPEDVPITTDALNSVRKEAGKAYDALAELPVVPPVSANPLMNIPASKGFDPKQSVYDLRVARNDADAYYKSYGRTADPEALTKAKAAKAEASRIETELEKYAVSLGQTDLLPALRDARQQIAKTYTVEKALNPTTGTIDARALAKELRKGKPLSGELKQAAEFANQFPKASQTMETAGGAVSLSPLDFYASGGLGLGSYLGGGSPVDAAQNAAIGLGARNVARSLILSSPVQNRLANVGTQSSALASALRNNLARVPAVNASLNAHRND